MANKTTEELPDASEPLAGTELVAGVQGGNSRKLSVNAIRGPKLKSLVDLATAAGDLIYGLGTGMLARLAKGTAGQILRMNAGATAPEWADPSLKAWVNFDGTTTPPTIRAGHNVSSVTRNSAGDYTINFTAALASANYAVVGSGAAVSAAPSSGERAQANLVTPHVRAAGSVRVGTYNSAINLVNYSEVNVAVFG